MTLSLTCSLQLIMRVTTCAYPIALPLFRGSILSLIISKIKTASFRSTLLWVGLLTVLLSCEWGLILLYYAQGEGNGDETVAIFLAAIAIFHAVASFIYHCLCNIKVRIGKMDNFRIKNFWTKTLP